MLNQPKAEIQYLEFSFGERKVVDRDGSGAVLWEVAQHLAGQWLHLLGSSLFFQIFFWQFLHK